LNQRDLLLLDSARLFLAPGVALEDAGLSDSNSGEVFTLNPLGQEIVAQLESGVSFKSLIQRIRRTYEVTEGEVRADVQHFISLLHSHQLLSIHQSFVRELAVRVMRRQRGRSPYRRYPTTPVSILAGSLIAQLPVAAIGLILVAAIQPLVFLPLLRQGSLPSPGMAWSAALPLIAYAGLLVGSISLHELIHYWTARRLGVQLKSVYVGPGRIGITQLDDGSVNNGIVSAAGPAVTALVLIVLALLLPQFHLGYPFAGVAAPMLCIAVAVVHLFGLTPWTSDGKQFWRLIALG
jgi:hypothetical protein